MFYPLNEVKTDYAFNLIAVLDIILHAVNSKVLANKLRILY